MLKVGLYQKYLDWSCEVDGMAEKRAVALAGLCCYV